MIKKLLLLFFCLVACLGTGNAQAAAKIQDGDFPVFGQSWQNVFHKFQEAVDLPEFVVSGMDDFSLFSHDPKIL